MTASILYAGNLRCEVEHIQSGTTIETDAPTDNKGKGEKFSPTDLLCVSLGTCMITTMAIRSADLGIDFSAASAAVTKHMLSDPRRVGRIDVEVIMPPVGDEKTRLVLERIGNNCPVAKSLHPDIDLRINYTWKEKVEAVGSNQI